MTFTKFYCNMNNWNFDYVNVEYGVTFKAHIESKQLMIVIVQTVCLFMFSPTYEK
jgi:hypothetical protein